jgi:GWxTD domain-containing protein
MRFIFSLLKTLCVAFLLMAISPAPILGSKDKKTKEERKREKEAKKRDQQQRVEEQQDYFKKWLEEDVVYIITDEERNVFSNLTADAERDAFIEQFWRRRDPDPRSAINEFKEEHYRRIAYANDHFYSGVEGWYTDRGRIYITYGPPNTIDDHMGGIYRRRPEEGGGWTSTYAFQRWFYNYIPGVGSGIEIEFVDASKTGEYKLALRPSEKDALWVSGGGPTRWEQMGLATRDGSMVSDLAMRRLGLETEPMFMRGAKPFDRLRQYFDLRRPPEFKFEKLATEVETRILYNPIPLKVVSAVYRVGQNAFLIPLTVQIPATELSYAQFGESNHRATVEIYGKVEGLSGKVVYEFEDTLAGDKGVDEILSSETHFLYQKQIPLRPGRFKFSLVAKDTRSQRVSQAATSIHVSQSKAGNLATSSLILADGFASSAREETLSDPFNTPSGLKVFPNITRQFRNGSKLHVYTEIYELQVDQAALAPLVQAKLRLFHGRDEILVQEPRMIQLDDRVVLIQEVELKDLRPGSYRIMLQVQDQVSGQSLVEPASFEIRPS